MLYINLINTIITILSQNGETRVLTLIKLINTYTNNIKVREPMVFDCANTIELVLPYENVMVDWGDGKINTEQIHIYSIRNKYRVKIYNSFEKTIMHVVYGWSDNITDFISIGRIGLTDLNCMFYYSVFNGKIHPNWDTGNITSTRGMFATAVKFNQKIPSNWDTSRVTDMSRMFYCATDFNQKFGDNWDTSQVVSMNGMFCDAIKFNQQIGDNWDTSKVKDTRYMFLGANSLCQKIGDNWDISGIGHPSGMEYMFPIHLDREDLPVWYNIMDQ